MKWLALFFFMSAQAMTCHVIEGSGGTGSAPSKLEAEKIAWRECISAKIEERERLRGPATEEDALIDAEVCLNAKMECK
jgi:hypothetical protein